MKAGLSRLNRLGMSMDRVELSGPERLLWFTAKGFVSLPAKIFSAGAFEEMKHLLAAVHWFRQGADASANAGYSGRAWASWVEVDGSFPGIWRCEGHGFAWARARLDDGVIPSLAEAFPSLPLAALVPIHAGYMAFVTQDLLKRLVDDLPGSWSQVAAFIEHDIAAGARGFAHETAAFCLRLTFPNRTPEVRLWVLENQPRYLAAFDHGIGRALAFDFPRLFFPKAGIPALTAEAPDPTAGRHMAAGFAFPRTLPNLQSPLTAVQAANLFPSDGEQPDAYKRGVACALTVWRLWAGEDEIFKRFRNGKQGGRQQSFLENTAELMENLFQHVQTTKNIDALFIDPV